MNKTETKTIKTVKNAPRAVANENGRSIELEVAEAEEAALEVAEGTDLLLAGGLGVEAAAQGEELARGHEIAPIGTNVEEAELTQEDRREVSRTVFRLAWPAIVENALQTLLGIVDTAVVARLGTSALSGVGAAQQLIWVLTTALIAISMGTTVLIARFVGEGNRSKANEVLKQSLLVAAATCVVLMPFALVSGPMLALMGLTDTGAQDGATYLSITMFMSISIVLMLVAGAALRGSGDTRTPMMVTAFINVINAILAIELVFGGAKASSVLSEWITGIVHSVGGSGQVTVPGLNWIPEMGVAGSAWATAISRSIGTLILLALFFLPKAKLKLLGSGSWKPNFDIIWRMLRIGIPSALEQLFMSIGILVFSLLVIGLGEVVFATSRLAVNAVFLSQMPGLGFAIAATTLVGQNLGARAPKRAMLGAQIAMRSALILMTVMGVVFYFFGEPILTVFTDDKRLLGLGAEAMKVIAFNQPALAIAFVLGGALRGAGDVRYPMWVTSLSVWLIRLPVGAFLGLPVISLPFVDVHIQGLNLGLVGVYWGLVVEGTVRAVLMFIRFRAGRWQTIKV